MGRRLISPIPFLIGPELIYIAIFLLLPLANIAVISFYTFSSTQIVRADLTIANYRGLIDWFHLFLFIRTFWIGLLTTILCAAIGYPMAYCLARARPVPMSIGLFLLVAPMMVSTVIHVFGWTILLGRRGLLNSLLAAAGVGPVLLLNTEGAVIVGLTSVFLPYMVLPLMASIERIPISLEEAAGNLGAGWWASFRLIILPLSVPGLVSGALLVFSAAISAFVLPALMGGHQVRMVGAEIYDALLVSFNWPSATSLAFALLVLAMTLVSLALRWGRGHRGPR